MDSNVTAISRRALLVAAGLSATSGSIPAAAASGLAVAGDGGFPKGFLWGTSTSGHQVEGGNVNSESWLLEHLPHTVFKDRSGDADDFYHLFRGDIALMASLGFNTFRMSIEWSRIEPEPGEYSRAELNHYRKVLACCREHGIAPVVTFSHISTPRWFAAAGGWENPAAVDQFARYCEVSAKFLGDMIAMAQTINEPNIGLYIADFLPPSARAAMDAALQAAAESTRTARFSTIILGDDSRQQPVLLASHAAGAKAIKSAGFGFPVGLSLAMSDDQAVGPDSRRDERRKKVYGAWLDAAKRDDDFVGVQVYTRTRSDRNGLLHSEPGVELTGLGYEFWPEAAGEAVRYAYEQTGKPIYVTENGVATGDDTRRIVYIDRALKSVRKCLQDGIPVRGYLHWSYIDNFEWLRGYGPEMGLVAVDRGTQKRTPKPSAFHLGKIARQNKLV